MRATKLLVGSILLFMVGSAAARTTRAQNTPRPLSAADVEHGLKSAVPNARMTALVKKYGVDFALTAPVEEGLRRAGASDNLLLEISRSRVRVIGNSEKSIGHSVAAQGRRSAKPPRNSAQTTAHDLLFRAHKY